MCIFYVRLVCAAGALDFYFVIVTYPSTHLAYLPTAFVIPRGSRLCRRESIHRAPVELPCYSAKAVTRQRGPTVRFNTVVQVAIVPSHRELDEATVNQMWWGAADLSLFRSAAIVFFRKYGKGSDVEEAEVFETVGPSPGMPYLHATAGTQTPRAAGDESPQRRRKAPGGQGGIGDGQDGRKSRFRFRGRSLSTSEGRRTTRGVFFSSPRSGRATRRRQKGADRDDSPYPPSRSRISAPATAGVDSIFAKNLLVQKPRYSRATSSEEHSRHAGAPPSVVYKSEPTGSHKLALTNPLDIAYE